MLKYNSIYHLILLSHAESKTTLFPSNLNLFAKRKREQTVTAKTTQK